MLWMLGYFATLFVVYLVWCYYLEKVYKDMEDKK